MYKWWYGYDKLLTFRNILYNVKLWHLKRLYNIWLPKKEKNCITRKITYMYNFPSRRTEWTKWWILSSFPPTDETSDTLNEDSLNLEASFKREEKKKEEDQTTKRSVCLWKGLRLTAGKHQPNNCTSQVEKYRWNEQWNLHNAEVN